MRYYSFVVLIWNRVWVALSRHCWLWAFSLCFAGESIQRETGVLVHRARSGPCNPITQSEKETGNAKHWDTTRAGLCMYLWVWCIISNKEWHVRLMSRPCARLGGFGYVYTLTWLTLHWCHPLNNNHLRCMYVYSPTGQYVYSEHKQKICCSWLVLWT